MSRHSNHKTYWCVDAYACRMVKILWKNPLLNLREIMLDVVLKAHLVEVLTLKRNFVNNHGFVNLNLPIFPKWTWELIMKQS